jgi:alanyl-tRNA synthetase
VRNQHRLVSSSPVIPFNDPTILFANAGMNQFKDIFTGQRTTDFKRATSSQKCIRAGGKHNDLDNVGFTARHHTFFEMLGNFSFGDYFKEEAIKFAWDWATNELKLPKDKLYATVYETDDDAFALWEKIAPELKGGRVIRCGKKDNFWTMGDIGPCGPCSEIHFDRGEKYGTGPNDVVNGETDRFVEIWNLVFMQYEQQPGGTMVPLPRPSVDTGAGLERIACVMQNCDTNYGIDLFQNIIKAISELTRSKYTDNAPSFQVIADHIRALTFALADVREYGAGVGLSNEGRGYVLRKILRRAALHGKLIGIRDPFLWKLVGVVVEQMGNDYKEIVTHQFAVESEIHVAEKSFAEVLEKFDGISSYLREWPTIRAGGNQTLKRRFVNALLLGNLSVPDPFLDDKTLRGDFVFMLQDTAGIPKDLIEVFARQNGLRIDEDGYETSLREQQERSRAANQSNMRSSATISLTFKVEPNPTVFSRKLGPVETSVQHIQPLSDPDMVDMVINPSPFYRESGGQIGDTGRVLNPNAEVQIESIWRDRNWDVARGHLVKGSISDFSSNSPAVAEVDADRRWDIQRNHTATHLTQAALRKVLGDQVKQSGSYVGPDRLRFDFSHHQPMTPEEIRRVEELVNEQILKGTEVSTIEMPIEEAKKAGAMALFGEKYGDTVRVVSVPGFSKELCGGTHVTNTAQIGPFFITLEAGIASGIRRIEAITGREAIKFMLEAKQFRREAASAVGRPEHDALKGIEQLREENSSLQKELKKTKSEMFSGGGKTVGQETPAGAVTLITHDFGETDKDIMSGWLDMQKAKNQPVVVVALGLVEGKPVYIAAASNAAVTSHKVDVGQISKDLLPQFGGRGGGKPGFAQGGVAVGTASDAVFAKVKELLAQQG